MGRRKRYSEEFKREALRKADEPGMTDVVVAEDLGISTRQLRRWRDAVNEHGEKAFPGTGRARDEEMMRLKRENAKLRQERDFLKEAAAYFAKESRPILSPSGVVLQCRDGRADSLQGRFRVVVIVLDVQPCSSVDEQQRRKSTHTKRD